MSQKATQNLAVRSDFCLQDVISNLPEVFYSTSPFGNGPVLFVTPNIESLCGYPLDQILADRTLWPNLIHPDDRCAFSQARSQCRNTGWPFECEYRIVAKDGSIRHVLDHGQPAFNNHGEVARIDGIMIDISKLKADLTEARRARDLAQKYLDVSQVTILVIGIDKKIKLINKKGAEILGGTESELIGKNWFDFLPEDIKRGVEAGFEEFVRNGTGEPIPCENRVIDSRGREKIMAWRNSLFRDENGNVQGTISFGEDVTEYRRLIEQLRDSEKKLKRANEELEERDRLKSEFVSTVAHEIRTPLCIFKNIISNTMAGIMGKINPKLRKNLQLADRNIDRLSRIISNFLDIAKIEAGQMELSIAPVDIQMVIANVVESFATVVSAKGLNLKTVVPQTPIPIHADRDRLVQILTNLLGNAVKFTNTAGHIQITLIDSGDSIKLTVRDDGPGIEAEDIPKVFHRFVQLRKNPTAEHGSGLGLTIAKQFVEMHHGKIWVESDFGHGCAFCFELPKSQPLPNTSEL